MNKNELILGRDFIAYVKGLVDLDYGSQKAFAEKHGLSPSYISDVLQGQREPGAKFLAAVGAERVVCYRLVPSSGASNPISAPGSHPAP